MEEADNIIPEVDSPTTVVGEVATITSSRVVAEAAGKARQN